MFTAPERDEPRRALWCGGAIAGDGVPSWGRAWVFMYVSGTAVVTMTQDDADAGPGAEAGGEPQTGRSSGSGWVRGAVDRLVRAGATHPAAGVRRQGGSGAGCRGLLLALKEDLARSQYPAFFRDAARLEAKAVGLCVYGLYAIPGLLQTADYARAGFELERS